MNNCYLIIGNEFNLTFSRFISNIFANIKKKIIKKDQTLKNLIMESENE